MDTIANLGWNPKGCRVTILDTVTEKQKVVDSSFNAYWWACGNGSCDCNRAIEMGLADELDKEKRREHPELEEWQELCFGCKRFLIIKSNSDEYSLDEFNSDYPDELKKEFLISDNYKDFQLQLNRAIVSEPLAFEGFDITKNIQAQLQKMIGVDNYYMIGDFYEFAMGYDTDISMEQYWLGFVMEKKFEEYWDGESWVE